MHSTNKFGEILAHLRKQKIDPIEGKVWSQQKLAELTGLSTKMIGDIERGRRTHVDEETAVKLARVLRLTTLQRQYFYELIHPVTTAASPYPTELAVALKDYTNLLAHTHLPAVIHDGLFNLISVNSYWSHYAKIKSADWETPYLRYNMLRLLVDPNSNFHNQIASRKADIITMYIEKFRAFSLCGLGSEKYKDAFSTLMGYPTFSAQWINSHNNASFTLPILPITTPSSAGNHASMLMQFRAVDERIVTNEGSFYFSQFVPINSAATKYLEKITHSVRLDVEQLQPLDLSCSTF